MYKLTLLFCVFCIRTEIMASPLTLLLCPSGTLHNPGKKVGNYFSRGLTSQFVQAVAKKIGELDKKNQFQVMVIDKRSEIFETPHGMAQYINQTAADVVIYIDFYQEDSYKATTSIFYFNHDSLIAPHKEQSHGFVSIQKAHIPNQSKSINIATKMSSWLQKSEYQSMMQVGAACGIPHIPLKGITMPTVGIEIGLQSETDWAAYVEPLANALVNVIHE
jgi:hypothetical protein